MRYAGEKRFNGWTALTLVLLALFLLFVIYPIGMLLIKSLFTGGKIVGSEMCIRDRLCEVLHEEVLLGRARQQL